ncbi:MAG: acyl-CoA dehydrogenase [Anaerolineaceae bacterium]|nr:acyl-CoA dehydrogenase [Anaerolineaceae bacterium]
MELKLSEEHRMIQDMARDFAQKEIAPIAAELDVEACFPTETVKKMGELGFMGIEIPEEYGGTGLDTLSYVLAMIEISKACASHGVIMSVNNSLVCHGIYHFGTEEQKQEFLVPLASGEKLGAYSLTEPQAGSDPANMRTTAVYDAGADEYVINGLKAWVTSGPNADLIVLFAMTDRSKGHRGISAFIADTTLPGFSPGKVEPKLGIRASHTSELVFEDYRLPARHRLGEEGAGFKVALAILDAGRIGIAAQAVGIAEAAFEAARDYAKERVQFGQPISEFQAIQWMLADMKTRLEAARLLTYQAALAKDEAARKGGRYSLEASMAKLYASEMAMWVTTTAVQIFGGNGYSKEYPVERYFRDAKITEIYEGTSEIQRMVIARSVLS